MNSIEWLEREIVKLEAKFPIPHAVYELCEQAKEKHKQEIIDAANTILYSSTGPSNQAAEQYYNEIFKKD